LRAVPSLKISHQVKVQILSDEFVRLHLNLSHEVFQNLKKLQTLLSKKAKKPISLEETIEKMSHICLEKLDPVKKVERAQSREAKKSTTQSEILLEQDISIGNK